MSYGPKVTIDGRRARIEHPVYGPLRMTIPVREELAAAGNVVEPAGNAAIHDGSGDPSLPPSMRAGRQYGLYRVTMAGTVPAGIRLCLIGHGAEQHRGLRMHDEPEYPGEWRDGGIGWDERGLWVPCPHRNCGVALVWYEAGYVPGYRICTHGHHAQLSDDGRTAKVVHH